jgi:carbamoyl-phosphate synthase large subunit
MPKRTDLQRIMILGAGPIVIGQACEFDYSGAQACKSLREEGYQVVLVNSNPATIMTDPGLADVTYIEPLDWRIIAKIIAVEKPDALLPTMGGQTALNCALDLARHGVLKEHNVELIGATQEAIDKAEDREKFDKAMKAAGLNTANSAIAHSLEEANQVQVRLGFPCVIRPSFTMGGSGGGIAYNRDEFTEICKRGLDLSPTRELLIDQSLLGWKEYEMEVVRDRKDNCIIVCTIENLDPMGVHTGDSITVAPAQTLTDKEFQIMRDAAIKVLRVIGVETGGSNVQFALNPQTGEMVVIEMNPRVSRSSALASKATGFPIAKVAAKLAVGYCLDELANDITGGRTPASFEPSIDYVVTKIPRFNFEKFPQAEDVLTTQMKSVGEVMAMGRTFQESLQKALRGLEVGYCGLSPITDLTRSDCREFLRQRITVPSSQRLLYVADAFRAGFTQQQVFECTQIDPWFLAQIEDLILSEQAIARTSLTAISASQWRNWKQQGFADKRLSELLKVTENQVRQQRLQLNITPVYKRVDSCAAEFATDTAYLYSTYESECEARPSERKKVMILGGGPNRIGQGIEFDYCCVHAAMAVKDLGYEAIMVNCNPETVSTDYDISDKLYFEPVTLEDVLNIVAIEKPMGLIVQYGGQTPLKLAAALHALGVPILGTSSDAIDEAEDRERFQVLINQLNLKQPPNRTAKDVEQGCRFAEQIGYPLVVRPSYVLGGRAMQIVHSEAELRHYMQTAVLVSNDSPVLLDRFLDDAIEVDVDAVCDGVNVVVGGIMQHIEQAGVHSGDSACSLPPYDLSADLQRRMCEQTQQMALALKVIGLMNVQFAVKGDDIYVLEVNPRASRTVPFVSKCIGESLAQIAARCMLGQSLADQGLLTRTPPTQRMNFFAVKEAVFPFAKFQGVDPILGPEMKSTGEVMGVGASFAEAFLKAQLAIGQELPRSGCAFISVRDQDKAAAVEVGASLSRLGFKLVATEGTAQVLRQAGVSVEVINKVKQGRPHIVDKLKNREIELIINTTEGAIAIADSFEIRRTALQCKVTYTTTMAGAKAICRSLEQSDDYQVRSLQSLHADLN